MSTPNEKKGGWQQSSLDPNGPLVWRQDSLDPQDPEENGRGGDKNPSGNRLRKLLPVLLPAAFIAAVWLIIRQPAGPSPSPSPEESSAAQTQTASGTEEEPQEASANTEETETEEETPVEIILPDSFGDLLADFTDDRYITNLSHYTEEPSLIGTVQEAAAVPWDALTGAFGRKPAFINHMSENLQYSFDGAGDFPYTDFTFSYDGSTASEKANHDIEYLKTSADSYEALSIGNLTEYSCPSGTYIVYEVYKLRESGPSLETYALRDLAGGGCFVCMLDQFYPSAGASSVSVAGDVIDDRYPEEFLTVLDALVKYSPEDFSLVRAVSPWAQQDYYAYDGGSTVFVDAKLSDASLPYYGFDHFFMTDNTMSLRQREDGTASSSCSRSFLYTVPYSEDGSYAPLSYNVSESIHYEFYRLYEDSFYTNSVTAPHSAPTGTNASDIISFTADGRTFYARCVMTENPGEYYPQGDDTIYVWVQISGDTGLIIRDSLKNFGDGPRNDVEEIARRLAGTIKNIH